jgi:surface polysaccharide O-acyltransferase-like enzyme
MPYAGIGLILKKIDIFERLKDRRYIAVVVSALLFIGGFYFTFPQYEGFFAGFYPIYMGLFLFLIFLLLPLENVSSEMRKAIYHVTRFTLGVYCAHRLVYGIMDILYELTRLEPKPFTKCVMTYLACYAMSYIVCLFPFKVFKKMVD